MLKLEKLKKGDKVAILSPSFAAPGRWPHVYELGLQRLKDVFGLLPVEYPTTKKLGASKEERTKDLISAFEDDSIKGVISTIGGDDQVTYIKNLPKKPFVNNPKPYFGYSDNTHFMNFLWLNGVPSYFGGALFTQFAEAQAIHPFTLKYLKKALFENEKVELEASNEFSDIGLDWEDSLNLTKKREYEESEGWVWSGKNKITGITWGGCIESIDELLRHGIEIPTLKQFEEVILIAETSEEIPTHEYVFRVFRALGERGILEKIKGVLVGRPKGWEFDKQRSREERVLYREKQRQSILDCIYQYKKDITVVQNLDFGHTEPQIPFPYGKSVDIDPLEKRIFASF